MSAPLNLMQLAVDHFVAQLLTVNGDQTSWSWDIAAKGIQPGERAAEQIRADECPYVCIFAERMSRTIGVSQTVSGEIGMLAYGVVVPDQARWPGKSAAVIAYSLGTEICGAIERSPAVPGTEMWLKDQPIDVLVFVDPDGSRFAIVEVRFVLELNSTLGN